MKLLIQNVVIASMLYQALASDDSKPELATKPTTRDLRKEPEPRIVGGEVSDPGEFPYFVDMSYCGGTLIAPGVVLSAAHCGNFKNARVIVGGYVRGTLTEGSVRARVRRSKRHPNYNSRTLENDFVLLRLWEDVPMSTEVTLSLNSQYVVPSEGDPVTTLGLGTLQQGGDVSNILRDVEVFAINSEVCNRSYNGEVIDDVMFCAGVPGGGKDSCQGDSGGPVVVRNGNSHSLVGVVSWGIGCALPGYPGVYARVSSANDWIKEVVCNDWNVKAPFCGGVAPVEVPVQSPEPSPTPVQSPIEAPQPSPSPEPPSTCPNETLQSLENQCNCEFKSNGRPWKNVNEYLRCIQRALRYSSCDINAVIAEGECLCLNENQGYEFCPARDNRMAESSSSRVSTRVIMILSMSYLLQSVYHLLV